MNDFKSRLLTEKLELEEKMNSLSTFISSDSFKLIDPKQQDLLNKQLPVMNEYADILGERIGLLN